MAKFKSVLFSDIRNKLGDSVVFSNWKGRGYFRSYVTPANPRTNKQMAHRDILRKLTKRWQEIKADVDAVSAWNQAALQYLISGFNLFMKYGRKSSISVPSTGTKNNPITITYTLGLPASEAGIYVFNGSTWVDITPAGGLSSTPNSTITWTPTAAGTYHFFIANRTVLKKGDTGPKSYQAITKYSPDITNGVAKEAVCIVS